MNEMKKNKNKNKNKNKTKQQQQQQKNNYTNSCYQSSVCIQIHTVYKLR